MIRNPVVAGAFYPADKNTLIKQINDFLDQAEKIKTDQRLAVLIVPHAGYDYSGQTAAWGFKQLEGTNYSRIFLLGCSHRAYFSGAAVYNQGAWQTPLGKVAIDEKLAHTFPIVKDNLAVHQQEHSLEVEIPFLQVVLKQFKIVPILLGQTNHQVLEDLAKAIASNFDKQTLLVISSDLSHYPSAKTAQIVDKKTIKAILSGDINQLNQIVEENEGKSGVATCACGAEAIRVGMMVAKKLGIKTIKLLNYSNSGNRGGDKNQVVGYTAIGFYGKFKVHPPAGGSKFKIELNQNQQKELLKIARETLEFYLRNKKIPKIKVEDAALQKKLGVFVTLRKKGQLRGCIGEFETKKPLYQLVQDKVVDAAIHDPRFPLIKLEELKEIEIEISVISALKKIDNWKQIKLGQDGVLLKKDFQGGLFLPQVAKETGWDLETFLAHLCLYKARLSPDAYKNPKVEIYTFTAQVFEE